MPGSSERNHLKQIQLDLLRKEIFSYACPLKHINDMSHSFLITQTIPKNCGALCSPFF